MGIFLTTLKSRLGQMFNQGQNYQQLKTELTKPTNNENMSSENNPGSVLPSRHEAESNQDYRIRQEKYSLELFRRKLIKEAERDIVHFIKNRRKLDKLEEKYILSQKDSILRIIQKADEYKASTIMTESEVPREVNSTNNSQNTDINKKSDNPELLPQIEEEVLPQDKKGINLAINKGVPTEYKSKTTVEDNERIGDWHVINRKDYDMYFGGIPKNNSLHLEGATPHFPRHFIGPLPKFSYYQEILKWIEENTDLDKMAAEVAEMIPPAGEKPPSSSGGVDVLNELALAGRYGAHPHGVMKPESKERLKLIIKKAIKRKVGTPDIVPGQPTYESRIIISTETPRKIIERSADTGETLISTLPDQVEEKGEPARKTTEEKMTQTSTQPNKRKSNMVKPKKCKRRTAKKLQYQNREEDSDSTTEEYTEEETKGAGETGGSLTYPPEERKLIYSAPALSVELCSTGNIHPKQGPAQKQCSRDPDCRIQLHQAEGILCKEHPHQLSPYRLGINYSLMLRTTRDCPDMRKECLICGAIRMKGNDILQHSKGHAGEMGRYIRFFDTVKEKLNNITQNKDDQTANCDECHAIFKTPAGLIIHRFTNHHEFYQYPLVCELCRYPLMEDTFDEHFERFHSIKCCGEMLKTAGKIMEHSILCHPRNLDNLLSTGDLHTLMLWTRHNPTDMKCPWGNLSRMIGQDGPERYPETEELSTPALRSQEFRQLYEEGENQSAVKDILIPYPEKWIIQISPHETHVEKVMVAAERLMTYRLAVAMNNYLDRLILIDQEPSKEELQQGDAGWCNTCQEQITHRSDGLCVDKRQLRSLSHLYQEGWLESPQMEKYAGVLIGIEQGNYGLTPVGQYKYLNLSMRTWEPLYTTGHERGQPVYVRKSGKHIKLTAADDYFQHVRMIVKALPADYMKPVVLELFIPKEESSTEEEVEAVIEAYYRNVNDLRNFKRLPYVIITPIIDYDDDSIRPDQYAIKAKRAAYINRVAAAFSIKLQLPTFIPEGIITSMPLTLNGKIQWTRSVNCRGEPLVDRNLVYTREYIRRVGQMMDIINEAYQSSVKDIINWPKGDMRNTTDEMRPITEIVKRKGEQEGRANNKPKTNFRSRWESYLGDGAAMEAESTEVHPTEMEEQITEKDRPATEDCHTMDR